MRDLMKRILRLTPPPPRLIERIGIRLRGTDQVVYVQKLRGFPGVPDDPEDGDDAA